MPRGERLPDDFGFDDFLAALDAIDTPADEELPTDDDGCVEVVTLPATEIALALGRLRDAGLTPHVEMPEADEVPLATARPAGAPASAASPGVSAAPTGAADPARAARVRAILGALGGAANVESVEAVAATRLRIVHRDDHIDEQAILAAGAAGVMVLPPRTLHVIVGLEAPAAAREMQALLQR